MPRLLPTEVARLNDIRDQHSAMIEQLLAWSAINSGSRNGAGLARMAAVLQERLAPLKAAVRLQEAAPVETIDAQGAVVNLLHGPIVHAVLRPLAPIQLLLVGHMDTVFGADHPFQTPAWRNTQTLIGPGVADMKGGLTVMIAALEALEASPWRERMGVHIVINSDEEIGSLGSADFLAQCARRAHAGLVFEPAMPDGTLAGARKGMGTYTAVVRGRTAHAGRNPQEGRNALLALADFLVQVAAVPQRYPGVTINPGRVEGGGPTNVVPDLAIGRFEARVACHQEREGVQAAIERLAQDIAAKHDVMITMHGGFTRPPKPLDAFQLGLFDLVRACAQDLDVALSWVPTGGCCDGNNLAATGLPVVDTLGVRGGGLHSPEEYMFVDSLVERAQLTALLLMRLAQGALALPVRDVVSIG